MSLTAPRQRTYAAPSADLPEDETAVLAGPILADRFPHHDVEDAHEPLSSSVAALVGAAALALSVVCTALLLTFGATTLDGPASSDGSTVLHTYGE
jgi:hypothetical protein